MSERISFRRTFFIFACLLLANGCTPDQPAEMDKQKGKGSPEQAQAQASPPQFVACHPPNADLSPDGNVFVALSPDAPILNIATIRDEQKQSVLKLPRPARDVILISAEQAVLSFGSTGEVALINLENGQVGERVRVGESPAGMCRTTENKILIADPEARQIHYFDPTTGSVEQSFPIKGKPEQMRWVTQDLTIEAADGEGNSIGTTEIKQESQPDSKEDR